VVYADVQILFLGYELATQGVYEYSKSYSSSDLLLFQKNFNIPLQPVSKNVGDKANGNCIKNCGEGNLDVILQLFIFNIIVLII
jgi:hypothetical protein